MSVCLHTFVCLAVHVVECFFLHFFAEIPAYVAENKRLYCSDCRLECDSGFRYSADLSYAQFPSVFAVCQASVDILGIANNCNDTAARHTFFRYAFSFS